MTDKNLYEQLREKVAAATAVADHAFDEAIAFADEHKLSFYWEGHACGMGGSYEGDPKQREHTYSENGCARQQGAVNMTLLEKYEELARLTKIALDSCKEAKLYANENNLYFEVQDILTEVVPEPEDHFEYSSWESSQDC